jgi:teichuronic acid biosynthesis glycosyltransferase TuaC
LRGPDGFSSTPSRDIAVKVLAISHLYPVPYYPLQGMAMHKQVTALVNKGCEVEVICPIPWAPFPINHMSHKWKRYSQVPGRQVLEALEVFYPRYIAFPRTLFFSSSGVRMYYGTRGLVKQLESKFPFDLIHAHMGLPDGYAGMRLSQTHHRPLVVTFRATDVDFTARRSALCLRALQRVFAAADKVISPSPRLSKTFYHLFQIIPATIGHGIDLKDVHSDRSDLRRRHGNRRILLSASRLLPTKGIDLNVQALQRLMSEHDDLLYLVIGDGPERDVLQRLTHDLALADHVQFLGHLPHRQVMEYMSICEVFTLPSWRETFGLVYLEAMAHGKPVVACRGQGVDGIVTHGDNGLLAEPRDVNSVIEQLRFLLDNADKARSIGERARKLVLENYTWERNAERTIELYGKILERSSELRDGS